VYKRAIVPLDGSPFAEAVLPFFRQIAGPLAMEVLLLRVVPPHAMAPMPSRGRPGRQRQWRCWRRSVGFP
jgi:hypothetical protein